MKRFEGKTILVTGASSGIGRATVERLNNEGARCVMIARDEAKLKEAAERTANPEAHIIIAFDLGKIENYSEIFKVIKDKGLCLDGLVHCAGFTKVLPLRTLSYESSLELFRIHYFAFIELVKWYSKKGISNGGSIVGISAINSHIPQKCMTVYASAKAAVEAACRSLAVELSEKGIRINSIVVGGVATNMGSEVHEITQAVNTEYVNPVTRQLLGVGRPEQIADAISFLLSDDASFITGREMYVDGGLL